MEDVNSWVTTIASWLTVLNGAAVAVKWLLPKVRESLKVWRSYKHKRKR